jgi:hypothetical protein
MTLGNSPSSAGHFELTIDGHVSTTYLKSVDGGYTKRAVIEEPMGHENFRIKHTSVAEIEPIAIEFGLAGADDVLKWIQASWRKDPQRHQGAVTHADFDLYKTFEHEFFEAMITETTFPTLDGASKEAAYIKCKIQPERVVTKKLTGKGQRVGSNMGKLQKLWTASHFDFQIDGIPEFKYTNKIDSFTIKQGVKKLYTGGETLPELVPTKIEFPHITGTIAMGYCDALHKWREESIDKGAGDPSVQKHGSLSFLGPDRKELFSIQLGWVGLFDFKMVASTANSDQIKRAKFDLLIGSMDIDGKANLGLE